MADDTDHVEDVGTPPTSTPSLPSSHSGRTERIEREPSFLGPQTLVTFIVGKENPQTFAVLKNFATLQSPVFDAAFNGRFIEGETQKMELKDVEPEIFGLLVHWLYTSKAFKDIDFEDVDPDFKIWVILAKLWILAERFTIPALQNEVMHRLFILREEQYLAMSPYINPDFKDLVACVYEDNERDPEEFPLKAFLVDGVARVTKPEFYGSTCTDGIPVAMWIDLTRSLGMMYYYGTGDGMPPESRYLIEKSTNKSEDGEVISEYY